MSLIGRIFVILFAFLAACFVAGMIVVGAVLYPEFSDLDSGMIDQSTINVLLGFLSGHHRPCTGDPDDLKRHVFPIGMAGISPAMTGEV